jgi:nucleoside-diphosphate-sugar epimerase
MVATPRTEMDRLHLDGTRNLLEAMVQHVPESVTVLFGSAAEYGEVAASDLPVREDYPARPESDFGKSKLAQLHLAEDIAAQRALRVLVVRPFNIVGPGLPDHYLPAALARRLRQELTIRRNGPFPIVNGHATRDWVDVRDVAEAVIVLLRQSVPAPGKVELYNIASGQETAVLEMAQKLCDLAGSGFTAVPAGTESSRSGIQRSCGDATRFRTAVGWQPRISWQESVTDLWHASTNSSDKKSGRPAPLH